MSAISPLNATLVAWGVVTTVLAVLLIYRALISMKEDDQLFLDTAQTNLEEEQHQVRKRLERLTPYTKLLGATSGALLVTMAGIWVYQQFTNSGILSQ